MDPNQRVIDYIRETAERIQTPDGMVTAATMLERFLLLRNYSGIELKSCLAVNGNGFIF